MVVLAIGAHPDDVEICCLELRTRCVGRGDRVVVCSVTMAILAIPTIDTKLTHDTMAEADGNRRR